MSDKCQKASADPTQPMPSGFSALTPREAEVLRDRFGLSNRKCDDRPNGSGGEDENSLRAMARALAIPKRKR